VELPVEQLAGILYIENSISYLILATLSGRVAMQSKGNFSRRDFLGAAASTAAVSCLTHPGLSFGFGNAASGALDAGQPPWRDQGVLHLANSPYAKLRSVPVRAVTIEEGFWSKRRKTNVERSIPTMREQLEQHGRMDNFRRLVGKSSAPQKGPYFADSDIYKWTEAAGFALQPRDIPELRNVTSSMIREVVAVQEPNGYLNTYYVEDRTSQRMQPHSQEVGHELYNLGHMLQGAIAYYRATGDTTLLDAGAKMVDGFLLPNFGPGPDKKPIVSGHPEIEMSLIELYRTTGNRRYVELAGYILQGDSRMELDPRRTIYMYSGTPFTSRKRLEGHAVRAMYACCGATDYYLETGDQAYWKTLNLLWDDLANRQMYITGGVGARAAGEAFGEAYELPNAQAYGESCAAIGNMMWNWRMLAATGQAKFTDVIERALYNGINSGMSLSGTLYCYRNPLAFDPDSGEHIRNPWYDVTCCPPNLERTFASLPGYFYSTGKEGVYVHLYDNSTLDWHLENGAGLKIQQRTNYPWDGDIKLTVSPFQPTEFTLFMRIPGWVKEARVSLNGKTMEGVQAGQYLAIRRQWAPGDTVSLNFPMPTEVLASNPRVAENRERLAVQRGPMVYCLEQSDQPNGPALADVALLANQASSKAFQAEHKGDLLDGVTVLHTTGAARERSSSSEALYRPATFDTPKMRAQDLMLIPYYAWANREPTQMEVWISDTRA
jgi:uncharacterized protein